jgi:hypothetical protein
MSSSKRFTSKSGDHTARFTVFGDVQNFDAKVVTGIQAPSIVTNDDGTTTFNYTAWPSIDEARPYGDIAVTPITFDMAHLVGRIIIQSAAVEAKVKSLLKQLCQHNQTTLDWQVISKYGKIVTRLQEEIARIRKQAPFGAQMLSEAAERTRAMHLSRGNLAHGDIQVAMGQGQFVLVAVGKNGDEWFTEEELRDLALRYCKVSYELSNGLQPDYYGSRRASREKRFLRDFQANNPLTTPKPPKPPRRLRSSTP